MKGFTALLLAGIVLGVTSRPSDRRSYHEDRYDFDSLDTEDIWKLIARRDPRDYNEPARDGFDTSIPSKTSAWNAEKNRPDKYDDIYKSSYYDEYRKNDKQWPGKAGNDVSRKQYTFCEKSSDNVLDESDLSPETDSLRLRILERIYKQHNSYRHRDDLSHGHFVKRDARYYRDPRDSYVDLLKERSSDRSKLLQEIFLRRLKYGRLSSSSQKYLRYVALAECLRALREQDTSTEKPDCNKNDNQTPTPNTVQSDEVTSGEEPVEQTKPAIQVDANSEVTVGSSTGVSKDELHVSSDVTQKTEETISTGNSGDGKASTEENVSEANRETGTVQVNAENSGNVNLEAKVNISEESRSSTGSSQEASKSESEEKSSTSTSEESASLEVKNTESTKGNTQTETTVTESSNSDKNTNTTDNGTRQSTQGPFGFLFGK